MPAHHQSVLLNEAISNLNLQSGEWYLDATFGRGGHTRAILAQGGKVIALDHDQEAIDYGSAEFKTEIEQGKLILVRESFSHIGEIVRKNSKDGKVAGMLFDLGTSLDQLKYSNRGFSFETDSELDMRMDERLGVKAKDILNLVDEKQLATLFREYGGEDQAKAIAKRIVSVRKRQSITHTQQLAKLIEQVKAGRRSHLHPATKVFQALRIAVNSEFDQLEQALNQVTSIIKPNGRIAIISFHEGEDRIAKNQFKNWSEKNLGEQLTKKPITPSDEEINQNSRSRSAKLRIFKFTNL